MCRHLLSKGEARLRASAKGNPSPQPSFSSPHPRLKPLLSEPALRLQVEGSRVVILGLRCASASTTKQGPRLHLSAQRRADRTDASGTFLANQHRHGSRGVAFGSPHQGPTSRRLAPGILPPGTHRLPFPHAASCKACESPPEMGFDVALGEGERGVSQHLQEGLFSHRPKPARSLTGQLHGMGPGQGLQGAVPEPPPPNTPRTSGRSPAPSSLTPARACRPALTPGPGRQPVAQQARPGAQPSPPGPPPPGTSPGQARPRPRRGGGGAPTRSAPGRRRPPRPGPGTPATPPPASRPLPAPHFTRLFIIFQGAVAGWRRRPTASAVALTGDGRRPMGGEGGPRRSRAALEHDIICLHGAA